jgi:hypothetical protein
MDWSPRTVSRWFVHPEQGFREWLSLRSAAVVVLALCLLNAVLVSQAASAVAAATIGGTDVQNQHRPPDWICEEAEPGGSFERYQDACETEPETVTRQFSAVAGNAAGGLVPLALLAPLAVWLAASGLFAVVMGGKCHDDPSDRVALTDVLAVVGVGLAPAALRYAGRTAVVERSLAGRTLVPASIEDAKRVAVDAMTPDSAVYIVVVVVTVAWSAYVWRGGLRAVIETESRRIDAAVVGVAVLLAVPAVRPVYLGAGAVGVGLALLALGLPAMAAPRAVERVELFFDLIGTRGDVEVKWWRVALTQVIGLALVFAGALTVGGLMLA